MPCEALEEVIGEVLSAILRTVWRRLVARNRESNAWVFPISDCRGRCASRNLVVTNYLDSLLSHAHKVPPLLMVIHAFINLIVMVGSEVSFGVELVPLCIAKIKCEFDCH